MSVLSRCQAEGLSYWWTYAVVFRGGNARQVRTRNIASSWRAVVAFRMEGGSALPEFMADPIAGGGREKDDHEWQQGVREARVFVDRLCPPGEQSLVLDPFSGSGTVAVAAALEGRRVIAADIDPDCAALTAHRVTEALATVDDGSSAFALPGAVGGSWEGADGVQ